MDGCFSLCTFPSPTVESIKINSCGLLSESHVHIWNFIYVALQADLCVPRLNEGDQVVLINGRDIAEHTHDQVVLFIKASCERHSGELVLLVRPNGKYSMQHWIFLWSVNICY